MKIAVVGVGGVGGYFGGKLAFAFQEKPEAGTEVYFVARGDHLVAIKRDGLVLKTSDRGELRCHPRMATDVPSALPPVDVFIVAVKGYDLESVSGQLSRLTSKGTVILPLLNGVDIRERMRKHIHTGIILPACVYVSSFIEAPGVVVQTGNPGRMIVGADPESGHAPEEVVRIIQEASIACDLKRDAYPAMWEKFVFIAGYGLITARYNKPMDQVYEEDPLRSLTLGIMEEIRRIASKKGISLPSDIVDVSIKKAQLFAKGTQTSLQRDVNLKKGKTELDLFGGTLLAFGRQLGVPTPVTRKIYEEILKGMSG